MKKSTKTFIIMSLLAILILPGCNNKQNTIEENNNKTSKSASTITPSDEWQTYKNDEIGIELKYPENWFVNQYPNTDQIYIFHTKLENEDFEGLTHGLPGSFEILIMDEENEWHWEEFERNIKSEIPPSNFSGEEYAKTEKLNIEGKDIYKIIQFGEADMASVGGYITNIWFKNNEYLINISFPNEYNESYDHEVFDEIFSTLRIF